MLREMLRQLPDLAKRLKPRVTVEELERGAGAQTDTVAVLEMQRAKQDVRKLSRKGNSVRAKNTPASRWSATRAKERTNRISEPNILSTLEKRKPKTFYEGKSKAPKAVTASRWLGPKASKSSWKGMLSGGSLRFRLQAHVSTRNAKLASGRRASPVFAMPPRIPLTLRLPIRYQSPIPHDANRLSHRFSQTILIDMGEND
jgi:hypothetical protein